jgi:L-2-hydroxyglutarate oxidase LhgO
MAETDIVIAGAGVVGLAVAARLASSDRKVFLIEKNSTFGQETSSRHSGVIHAGIYYPRDSLKAKLCVQGNRMLYEICQKYDIPFKRRGKLIVATAEEEAEQLEALLQQGRENGVSDLQLISRKQLKSLEPNVAPNIGALLSPSTGIIDAYSLMRLFLFQAREKEATVVFKTEIVGIEKMNDGYRISVKDPRGYHTFQTQIFINCTGLNSAHLAALAGIDIDKAGYRLHYCKGEYFALNRTERTQVHRLVYPVPKADIVGLGIHITPDLEGKIRLGPNAYYVTDISYDVDISHKESFCQSAQRLVPAISVDDVEPDFAGIRPKLQGPGDGFRDFVIRHEADRGLPGLINLVGIESPGLTSSPAIAEYVAGIVSTI